LKLCLCLNNFVLELSLVFAFLSYVIYEWRGFVFVVVSVIVIVIVVVVVFLRGKLFSGSGRAVGRRRIQQRRRDLSQVRQAPGSAQGTLTLPARPRPPPPPQPQPQPRTHIAEKQQQQQQQPQNISTTTHNTTTTINTLKTIH
jgi:Sec-independent protein translocase protein TatA